jgi:Tfp pilus assembly protein PilF
VAETLKLPRKLETSSQGRFNLGVAYAARAKEAEDPVPLLEAAEHELRLALEADDRFAISWVELAKVLARLNRNEEARELYRRAAEIEPDDYRNQHAIGLLSRRLGDLDAAERAFREALRLEPRHTASARQLEEVLRELERRDAGNRPTH